MVRPFPLCSPGVLNRRVIAKSNPYCPLSEGRTQSRQASWVAPFGPRVCCHHSQFWREGARNGGHFGGKPSEGSDGGTRPGQERPRRRQDGRSEGQLRSSVMVTSCQSVAFVRPTSSRQPLSYLYSVTNIRIPTFNKGFPISNCIIYKKVNSLRYY